MNDPVRDVLRAFDALTPTQQQAAAEVLRRSATGDGPAKVELAPEQPGRQENTSENLLPNEEAELEDWNAYFGLLLSGQLKSYGGRFIVVHKGKVIAAGDDPEQLENNLAEQLGVAPERLVIAFVDDTGCISAEGTRIMPRINLAYLRADPQTLGTEIVTYERIKALLEIASSAHRRKECLVDTGSILSVFPERQWRRCQKVIDWLYIPGSRNDLPKWLTQVAGFGAQPIPCRIGKIKIQIIELPIVLPSPRRAPQVEIIAKFPHDGGAYSQILLGVGGRAFVQWKMVVDSANGAAWLEY